jgi:hypothetical protein
MRGVPLGSFNLSSVWTTTMTGVADVVSARMREEANGTDQPLDSAGTYPKATL